ncbi:extracellular solute-binding protein [Salinarimonas sp.]|uniref:sensor histidine kinase n=1 Tax=Salinarimonas sp. TaxID=2766526 RepID=UPI0032D8D068
MIEARGSLVRRLVIGLALVFAASAVALGVGAASWGRRAADAAYDQVLAGAALSIAETIAFVEGRVVVDVPLAAFDMLALARDDRVFYQVVAPDGALVTGYADLPAIAEEGLSAAAAFGDRIYRGETVRIATVGRLIADPGLQGWARVSVGQTRGAREALARDVALGAILPLVGFAMVALVLAGASVIAALRPLRRLERDLAARGATDLRPLSGEVPGEIARLVAGFNTFVGRFAGQLDAMRAFISDAAHQMRTPLATMKAEIALQRERAGGAETLEALAALEAQVDGASARVDQLLAHAFVSNRSQLLALELCDLARLVPDALREISPLVLARGADIVFDGTEAPVPVLGDAVLLREALRNLVVNALEHAARPGRPVRIRVAVETAADGARLIRVEDDGPGIPFARRAQVLERFNRPGGGGLGLAIVDRVARAHGGALALEDGAAGGLAAVVRLPAAPGAARRPGNPRRAATLALAACLAGLAAVAPEPLGAQTIVEEFPARAAPARALRIHSATDLDAMRPVVRAFQERHPAVAITFVDMNTNDLYEAALAAAEGSAPAADVIVSSAMDLQLKLANDGLAARHVGPIAAGLPDWARWRDEVFAFTYEPAVIVYNPRLLAPAEAPRTRFDLVRLLRDEPERFREAVVTYDIVDSGVGYLMASQDAAQAGTFANLVASFGRIDADLVCCTSIMLEGLAAGRWAIGYNLLGSYAQEAIERGAELAIVLPEDVTLAVSRTALVSAHAPNPQDAARFLDFLISVEGQAVLAEESRMFVVHPAIRGPRSRTGLEARLAGPMRPIRLTPSLLAYLDGQKKPRFLAEWSALIGYEPGERAP